MPRRGVHKPGARIIGNVIAREERYLAKKFGADYEAYRQKVRRWL